MIFTFAIIAHVILAVAVTTHVLLHKREARSAIGWMSVAWFSPFIGSLGYGMFGINRVARGVLKSRLQTSFATTELRNWPDRNHASDNLARKSHLHLIGNAISGHPIVSGNRLEILSNGDEAYPEMIAAIKKAKKSIALTSYIFRLDESGLEFADVLEQARNRNVDIKVLVDGIGGGFFNSAAVDKLNQIGIHARRFMASFSPWRIAYLNLRNHKKLLIVDGKTGFVGGMNLGNENLVLKKSGVLVRDTHFCFKGPVVRQLLESFAQDWYFTTNEELTGDRWWPVLDAAGSVKARVIDSGPDRDLGGTEKLFSAAINDAKYHIRIVTPYFLPDERIVFLLEMALLRGVKIELVVPRTTDHSVFDWALDGQLAFMDTDRIACHRSALPFDHSKLVTVDGEWCAIGSPNWDARSMRLNFEVLVECHDVETVRRIDRLIDLKIMQSMPHREEQGNCKQYFLRLRNAAARLLMPYL